MATRDHQARGGIAALQAVDLLARLALGLRCDRAGIEHHEVRLRGIRGYFMPTQHELAGPGFELGLVQATTEGLEIDVHAAVP